MEINVEEEFYTTKRGVILRISGTEPLSAPYSRNGATFQPARMVLSWYKDSDKEWTLNQVRVVGGLIKKDGTVSDSVSRELVWYRILQLEHSAPDWVQEIVEEYAPKEEK